MKRFYEAPMILAVAAVQYDVLLASYEPFKEIIGGDQQDWFDGLGG